MQLQAVLPEPAIPHPRRPPASRHNISLTKHTLFRMRQRSRRKIYVRRILVSQPVVTRKGADMSVFEDGVGKDHGVGERSAPSTGTPWLFGRR